MIHKFIFPPNHPPTHTHTIKSGDKILKTNIVFSKYTIDVTTCNFPGEQMLYEQQLLSAEQMFSEQSSKYHNLNNEHNV